MAPSRTAGLRRIWFRTPARGLSLALQPLPGSIPLLPPRSTGPQGWRREGEARKFREGAQDGVEETQKQMAQSSFEKFVNGTFANSLALTTQGVREGSISKSGGQKQTLLEYRPQEERKLLLLFCFVVVFVLVLVSFVGHFLKLF